MYPTRALSSPYVCTACARRILSSPKARPRKHHTRRFAAAFHNAYSTTNGFRNPLRLAIIGSGPAGFYTAHRLMSKVQDAVVDMYEQLPVPYGLVRFGVAPDHPEVKNCQDTFEQVALSPRFTFIGNVRVGHDIGLLELKPHYDAILFSYGASKDRKLGIPGEDLPGVYSAREFVGWYNGLPQFQELKPQLQAGEQAVVIGQGNVAMDVARILLSPVDSLKSTDITEEAIQTLSDSKVKSVRVVGRRGPVQAAFTVKEARELMQIPSVAFEPIDRSLYPPDLKTLPRVQKRIADVLLKGTPTPNQNAPRTWALDFLLAPKTINQATSHISSITFTRQSFPPTTSPFDPSAPTHPTPSHHTIETPLVFRSVGYQSTALPTSQDLNIPFDSKLGIIPNDPHGRILNTSQHSTPRYLPGLYCAGWVKRGPTGVIASTMQDAFSSADIIAHDWANNVPLLNDGHDRTLRLRRGYDALKVLLVSRGVRPTAWKDWEFIDRVERERGKEKGKVREKLTSVGDMLRVLDAAG